MTTKDFLKSIRPELRWTPLQGVHTTAFIERKSKEPGLSENPETLNTVLLEAQTILGRCVDPSQQSANDTGLVIGYVQSGKTLSFTTVMALARDNGFQLVILLAGVGTNLKNQSERRLEKDLGFVEDGRSWTHFENPSPKDKTDIQNALEMWSKAKIPPHKRRAVLITVLKQHVRLRGLVALLKQLKLSGVPTLVIDDEADQASLNNKTAANKNAGTALTSTTYEWITQLKSALPLHTFLQYTATPQANLLLEIADVLSPSFAELVSPGSGYLGGKELFQSTPALVEVIPASDIPSPTNTITRCPQSLQKALRLFLLGAAAHTHLGQKGNRSMMVHPSQSTTPHGDYKKWIDDTIASWQTYFDLPQNDPAYKACADLFKKEYKTLKASFVELPIFEELMEVMPYVLMETRIVQVNSTKQGQRDVQWIKAEYWILIGGKKLDRGFTVEGLTITYMPRSISNNADTLQQRARFLGYKQAYKGLCRVFLLQDVKDAFEKYTKSEEFIRGEIEKYRGLPLMEWKRDFMLPRNLNPTRASVIGLNIKRVSLDEGWVAPRAMFRDIRAVQENRKLIAELMSRWKKQFDVIDAAKTYPEFKDNRNGSPRNLLIENIPVKELVEVFIPQIRISDPSDSETHTAVSLALNETFKNFPNDKCDVFLIAELKAEGRGRAVDKNGINEVFQGKSPNTNDFDKLIYVGDRELRHKTQLTLHLRMFNLNLPAGTIGESKNVPWFALYMPKRYVTDFIIEEEGRPHVRKR